MLAAGTSLHSRRPPPLASSVDSDSEYAESGILRTRTVELVSHSIAIDRGTNLPSQSKYTKCWGRPTEFTLIFLRNIILELKQLTFLGIDGPPEGLSYFDGHVVAGED